MIVINKVLLQYSTLHLVLMSFRIPCIIVKLMFITAGWTVSLLFLFQLCSVLILVLI